MSAEREHHTYRLPKRTLTRREREVVRLAMGGFSIQETAWILGVKWRTAKTHMENLKAKLGLHTRTEVVRWAVETGVGAKE